MPLAIHIQEPRLDELVPRTAFCHVLRQINHLAMIHSGDLPGLKEDRQKVEKALGKVLRYFCLAQMHVLAFLPEIVNLIICLKLCLLSLVMSRHFIAEEKASVCMFLGFHVIFKTCYKWKVTFMVITHKKNIKLALYHYINLVNLFNTFSYIMITHTRFSVYV